MLKDIIRNLSSDNEYVNNHLDISVVDERGEISAMYKGKMQTNLGENTDVLENIPKTIGLKMMIRSMSPDVIISDEIGGANDAEIINYAMCSGCKGIFTAHGDSIESIRKNPELEKIFNMRIFERIIILSKKQKEKIDGVFGLDQNNNYVKMA